MRRSESQRRRGSGSGRDGSPVSGAKVGTGEDRISKKVREDYEAMTPLERAVLRMEARKLIEERPDLVRQAMDEARADEVLREVSERFAESREEEGNG